MKLAYERPMMHAEMYQTNAYCASGCKNPNLLESVITSLNSNWMRLYKQNYQSRIQYYGDNNNDGVNDFIANYDEIYDFTHSFEQSSKNTFVAGWYNNANQYYWHATGDDGKTYYLEYSQEWTDEHAKQGGNRGAGSVFVLYQETNSEADGLTVNYGGFTGTPDTDLDDRIDTDNADMALAGVYFEQDRVYWST